MDLDWFKFRPSDSKNGRFWQIDPLASEYPYNSPYAFQENKFGSGIELEGKELFPWANVIISQEPIVVRPAIEPSLTQSITKIGTEVGIKTSEVVTRSSSTGKWKPTPEQRANFARGNKAEAEQLKEMGVEKNTKPYEAIDPKTGKAGKTIPDAIKDGQTIDIKNVARQGLSKQLRLQKEISNSVGKQPILRINRSAELSNPLKDAGFDIQAYSFSGVISSLDNLNVVKPQKMKEKNE